MNGDRVESQASSIEPIASETARGVTDASSSLNSSGERPRDSRPKLTRRTFLAGALALAAKALTPGRSSAASAGPEDLVSAETREQKAEVYMRQVVKEDKLPKPGEGEWNTDRNAQRIKTTYKYSPENNVAVIISYLETPDGQFLQETATIRITDTQTGTLPLITPPKIEETLGSYVKLGHDERINGAAWQFQRGGQNVPPRTERIFKDAALFLSEGAILDGTNTPQTGQFVIQVGNFSPKTTEYQQGTGFAGR